jgi:pyruvate/2-oxoglutarate/acetoin dehydrogenase E1 component
LALGRTDAVGVRGPSGGGVRAGPFHSQNPEGWLQHVPGLKIVQPATAYDAKGLLKAAIEIDPVLYSNTRCCTGARKRCRRWIAKNPLARR